MITEKNQTHSYQAQMSYKQTALAKAIGQNWFNTLERLSEKSDVSLNVIVKALQGRHIGKINERKILDALSLQGIEKNESL